MLPAASSRRLISKNRNVVPRVHFVLCKKYLSAFWPDLSDLLESNALPDAMPHRFMTGRDVWIVQTLLELKARFPNRFIFSFGSKCIANGINVMHYDSYGSRSAYWRGTHIVIRADRDEVSGADWVVIQTPTTHQKPPFSCIPSWPQPGLLYHNPADSFDIQRSWNVVYFGRIGAFPAEFCSEEVIKTLAELDFNLEFKEREWWDYRAVDVAISFRSMKIESLQTKPPSKLVNAWRAGVPMICDAEPSFAALYQSETDYLKATTPEEMFQKLLKLRSDPALYERMVQQGRTRGRNFDRDVIAQQWLSMLEGFSSGRTSPRTFWQRLVYGGK